MKRTIEYDPGEAGEERPMVGGKTGKKRGPRRYKYTLDDLADATGLTRGSVWKALGAAGVRPGHDAVGVLRWLMARGSQQARHNGK